MQVISVERWTFWSAVVVAVAGPALSTGFGIWTSSGPNGTTTFAWGGLVAGLVFVLLLVSVIAGGSRDSSVRSLPATAPP
jgi:hypothetical protein